MENIFVELLMHLVFHKFSDLKEPHSQAAVC